MNKTHCVVEFLSSGVLGPLHLGMNGQRVVDSIGEPIDVGYQTTRRALGTSVLLYGTTDKVHLQLSLTDGILTGIWLYFWGSDDLAALPTWMEAATCPIRGTTTIREFHGLAESMGWAWRIHDPLTFEDQTTVIIDQSKVQLIWAHNPELLEKIILSA